MRAGLQEVYGRFAGRRNGRTALIAGAALTLVCAGSNGLLRAENAFDVIVAAAAVAGLS